MFKKKNYTSEEVVLDGTQLLMYMREGYWQARVYLMDEGKYLRRSLRTQSLDVAKERGWELWRKLQIDRDLGRKQFSPTIEEGIDSYLEVRKQDITPIGHGGITKERWSTIKAQLRAFRRYMKKHLPSAKISDLEVKDCWQYNNWRREDSGGQIAVSTLKNEQAMINSCVRYWYSEGLIRIPKLEFPKINKLDKTNKKVKDETFAPNEMISFRRTAEEYIKGRNELIDNKERLRRKIVYLWIMVGANTGLRTGEQRQLRWENVRLYKNKDGIEFAEITVLAETSKVRADRTIPFRASKYFKILEELTGGIGYVFSDNEGKTFISDRVFRRMWKEILDRSKLPEARTRYLNPYGLRHYFITQRIDNHVQPMTLAKMCGTSVEQINKTYYHATQKIKENAAIQGRYIEELERLQDE